jgi:hypothetical protein
VSLEIAMPLLHHVTLSDPEVQKDYERALAVRAEADPAETGKAWGRGRIFVSIASFRDPETQLTLRDMLEKADKPERVHVGLVWQFDPEVDQDFFEVKPPHPGQIRQLDYDWRLSRGVCWARFLAQAMWRGEEFYFQIDSHMRFEQGWDTLLIEDIESCPDDKAVLASCAPPYLSPGDLITEVYPGLITTYGFMGDGHLRFTGVWMGEPMAEHHRMPYIMAGSLAARSTLIEEVPYDPYAHFGTEEISYAIRLFTHGWNVYSPCKRVVWHQFQRNNTIKRREIEGKDFLHDRDLRAVVAYRRFNHMSNYAVSEDPDVLRDLALFGLGKARSIAEYEDYAGLDFRRKRASEHAMRLRSIEGIENITSFKVPPLDDEDAVRQNVMSENERLLRIVLRGWTVEALATEMAQLLIAVKTVQSDGRPPEKSFDDLLADFRGWDKDSLVSELAHLAWLINQHNEMSLKAA